MKNFSLLFFLLIPATVVASAIDNSSSCYQDPELRAYLSQAVSNLEVQSKYIKEQYVSVTSRLAKLEYDLPEKFQCLSNLFQFSNSRFSINNDARLNSGVYEINDFERFFLYSEEVFNSGSSFATLEELIAVSNQVVDLKTSFTALSSNLASLSNAVNSIANSLSNSQGALQNLSIAYNRLDEICEDITNAITINDDGSVVIARSSPIVGRIDPTTGASYWLPAVDCNWDRAGNTFRVSRDTQLESVTLYCDNVARILSPQNVYISACVINSGVAQIVEYPAALINTSNFPRITYSFSSPVQIFADRDYLLCVKRTGNTPLYVYTCSSIRYGDFYKPYGASNEPRGGGDEPRSGMTPQQFFYEYLSFYWSLTYTMQDIWSIFKFSDDESFTFNENGFAVESGNITVGGSAVVTSSSLGDMFVSLLAEHPNLFNSKISWEMFCDDLKDMLITTNGGTVIGSLKVSDLKINGSGDWVVGSTTNSCNVVIANSTGKIIAPNGDLTLLATEGGNIQAQSFLQFQNSTQCGVVEIPINSDASSPVSCSGLTSNAIILLTPRQETTTPYWVVVNASNESFCVRRQSDGENIEPLFFNYLIIRK
ncbi:hypothetical protein IKW72_07780 [bacterium]|nr:hypothetical protein [bacterium]